jgi:hypothetical protein
MNRGYWQYGVSLKMQQSFVEAGKGKGNNFFKAVCFFMSSKYGVPSSNRTSLDINNLLEGG